MAVLKSTCGKEEEVQVIACRLLTIPAMVEIISVLVFSRSLLSLVLKLRRGARIRCLVTYTRKQEE